MVGCWLLAGNTSCFSVIGQRSSVIALSVSLNASAHSSVADQFYVLHVFG